MSLFAIPPLKNFVSRIPELILQIEYYRPGHEWPVLFTADFLALALDVYKSQIDKECCPVGVTR